MSSPSAIRSFEDAREILAGAPGPDKAAARGVSAYPARVTAQMVENFQAGGAAVACHAGMATFEDPGVSEKKE